MSAESVVTVRLARLEDHIPCASICYDAFAAINAAHGFPCDFPSREAPVGLLKMMFSTPGIYSVVAELDGCIIGSNCLDERSIIHGVGPITVDPKIQNHGAGRKMMDAVLDRSRERNAAGIRLVQAAFHNRSLSLYTKLGFDTREPLSCMQGRTVERSIPGCAVRPATATDIPACNKLSLRVHGFDRGDDLALSIEHKTAVVVERAGRITGYSSHLAFFGHTTAESNIDTQALFVSVDKFGGPGILVPTRNSALFRWCLQNGLKVVEPMTLMTSGLYNEPAGAWTPSVLF